MKPVFIENAFGNVHLSISYKDDFVQFYFYLKLTPFPVNAENCNQSFDHHYDSQVLYKNIEMFILDPRNYSPSAKTKLDFLAAARANINFQMMNTFMRNNRIDQPILYEVNARTC